MKSIIKFLIIIIIVTIGYNYLRNENEELKAIEYEFTTTSVRKIVMNQKKYSEITVTVSGKVKTSINFLGVAYYSLVDVQYPDYEIWVKPKLSVVPDEGSLEKVRGMVKQRLKLGALEVICIEEI